MEKRNQKYYCTIDKDDVIWGIGLTPKLSRGDAKRSLIYQLTNRRLLEIECTQEVFEDVFIDGYCHEGMDVPYWKYDRKKKIAYYPKEEPRANVFKELTKK